MAEHDTDSIRSELHAAGLRATGARIAVLQVLRRAERPVSHGDVVAALGTDTWNRATLYRNLIDLEKATLVRRTQLGGTVWRFEAASQEHGVLSHPHFVCTSCRKVVCLPELEVAPRPAANCRRAIAQGAFEVHLLGVCDTCGGAS
ncbi:transcriptional repressor [bacterium]|nr:MAG: transcriptional repressor [bacterium]